MNVKDNYGDVYFSVVVNDNAINTFMDLTDLKNLLLHPNVENMPALAFESIEDPDAVVALAVEAKNSIIKSNI